MHVECGFNKNDLFHQAAVFPSPEKRKKNVHSTYSIFRMMSEVPRPPSTKEKLATIVHGFDEFDTEMKRGTRVIFMHDIII